MYVDIERIKAEVAIGYFPYKLYGQIFFATTHQETTDEIMKEIL